MASKKNKPPVELIWHVIHFVAEGIISLIHKDEINYADKNVKKVSEHATIEEATKAAEKTAAKKELTIQL